MKRLLGVLLSLALAATVYAADVKISELTEVTSPTTSTAVLAVVDAGATKKVTIDNLLKVGSVTQAYDADLTTMAGLTVAQGKFIIGSAVPAWSVSAYTLPITDGTNGQILKTNGSGALSWAADAGGTVDVSGTPANHYWTGWTDADTIKGFTITASKPVCSDANGDPAVCAGTEGVWQVAGSYQASDTELTALAGLTSAANAIPYFTGSGTAGTISSSANMVSLLGSADYATARTNLGLAIGTNVQAYDAELAAIAGLTFADKSMIQLTGAGAASVLTCASANQLIGVNAANDALECKSTISVTIDDSAAQFTSATASKGTLKFDQTGITDTKTVTVKYTAADSYTFTPTLTGNTGITYPTSGTLINSTPTLTGDITSTTPAVDWDLKDNDASALSFDAADKAGIINIVTTNSAEGVTMSGTLGVTGIATFTANPKIYDGDSHHLSLDVADLGGDATLLLGGTFTNTKWCSFGTATGLTCNEDAPAGSGDITAVGSCATGSCATIGNADTSGGYIDFLEDSDNGSNYVRLKAPDSTADATVTLPGVTSTLAILGANTFTADQTITGNIIPEAANTRTIGSATAEWADIYLGDGAVIYGENDSSNTITSAATGWTFAKAVTVTGTTTHSDSVTIADGKKIIFDESAANPDDADIELSATDGVFKIAAANGAFNEDLTIDLDATENTATVNTSTGVTAVSFSALNLVTTGTISGAIPIVTDADGRNLTAAECYGTLHVATGAGTWLLPAAAAGMNICLLATAAAEIIIDIDASDDITLVGVQDTDGDGITNASGEAAGDFVCLVAIDATHWYVMGKQGTWAAQ